MNSSIKRFAAILFVATALSGAANAKLNLVNFKKHADIVNFDKMLSTMTQDLTNLSEQETAADVEENFKAVSKMLVDALKKNNTVENQNKVNAFVELFSNTMICHVDYADIARITVLKAELVKSLKKNTAGIIDNGVWLVKTVTGYNKAKNAYQNYQAKKANAIDQKAIEQKLAAERADRAAKALERPGKQQAFDTAFDAVVTEALDKKVAIEKAKDFSALEQFSADVNNVSTPEQKAAHGKNLVATFEALNLTQQAIAKNEEVKTEVARIEANNYGYVRNRGSKAKSTKAIANLTAEIVVIVKDINTALKDVTFTAKNIIVTKTSALVTEAQAATANYPVVK